MTDWIILGFWIVFFIGLFWPVLRTAGQKEEPMAAELQCMDCWDVPEVPAGEPGLMPWPPGAPEADPETLLLCGKCWEWQFQQTAAVYDAIQAMPDGLILYDQEGR